MTPQYKKKGTSVPIELNHKKTKKGPLETEDLGQLR